MKKGKVVGISSVIIVVVIVFGIASLPDEVLLESPTIETSENLPPSDLQIDIPSGEISITAPEPEVVEEPEPEVVEEPEPEVVEEPEPEVVEEPEPEVVEEPEPVDDETSEEGKIISIKIKDGVGGADK